MTIFATITGRLGFDPEARETKAGKPMTTARLAVTTDPQEQNRGDSTLWIKVLAFGRLAEQLANCSKGETISVVGQMRVERWQDKQTGAQREGLTVVADSLLALFHAAPARARGSDDRPAAVQHTDNDPQQNRYGPTLDPSAPFNDDLPF